MTEQQQQESGVEKRHRSLGVRQIIGLVFLVAFVVFLAENTQRVTVRLIVPEERISLALALLIAGVLGAIGVLLVQYRRRHH